MRRMGRYNLSGVLAAERRQDRRSLRTHPTRRPREDNLSAEAECVISLPTIFLRSPPVQATVGVAALCLLQRNSLPSTHIRCRTTARRLATQRWPDVSRAAGPPAGPTLSATTIYCRG